MRLFCVIIFLSNLHANNIVEILVKMSATHPSIASKEAPIRVFPAIIVKVAIENYNSLF
jgi:hypothetical protein